MSLSFFQNVQPKAGTPGVAEPSGPAQGGQAPAPAGSMFTMLLPILILVPFLFLNFRRQKKEQQLRASLKKGDRVVSQSGLIGELIEHDDRIAKVKIAPGTNVQVLTSTLSPFDASPGKSDKDLADLKEAKATADKK